MSRRAEGYLPALGVDFLTPLYDPLVRLTIREVAVKTALLNQARINDDARVLDVGCGTGTLLLLLKGQVPAARSIGLDGDHHILAIAASKGAAAGEQVPLIQAFSSAIPFSDCAFDRILSSLMLHHLTRPEKIATLREVFRVLRPGGELHVADWGPPHRPLMAALSWTVRLWDTEERTTENVKGALPVLFRDAGFEEVSATASFGTLFGTLQLYRARKPHRQGDQPIGAGADEGVAAPRPSPGEGRRTADQG